MQGRTRVSLQMVRLTLIYSQIREKVNKKKIARNKRSLNDAARAIWIEKYRKVHLELVTGLAMTQISPRSFLILRSSRLGMIGQLVGCPAGVDGRDLFRRGGRPVALETRRMVRRPDPLSLLVSSR